MSKILLMGNSEIVLYNFRLELIKQLLNDGHQVVISCPNISGKMGMKKINEMIQLGCIYEPVTINRHGTSIIEDIKLYYYYKKLFKKQNPDIVFSYTIKPNIYGAVAADRLNIPFVPTVTGLGIAVEKPGIIRNIIINMYRIAFRNVQTIFFQNTTNRQFFIDHNIGIDRHKILPGSGVNLEHYYLQKYPSTEKSIDFCFIARIMEDKGINELLDAAKAIKVKYPHVNFHIYGFLEDNFQEKLDQYIEENIIEYHGVVTDVREVFRRAHCTILPSYHEGLSNVLLESASSGRPVLASNIPGCQETFDEGVSGFGFMPKNTKDLEETIEKFILLTHDEKEKMGIAGRKKVEKEFDRRIVVSKYIEELNTAVKNQRI